MSAPGRDHFDGRRFHHPWPITPGGGFNLPRWLIRSRGPAWPARDRLAAGFSPARPAPRSAGPRVTWIGHATALIQIDGLNLLTDPVYGAYMGPLGFLGGRRHHPPGIAWADLPPIDAVLVSHAHYDHLDRATIRRLQHRDAPLFIAGWGLERWFARRGCKRVVTLDWWQDTRLPGTSLRITATPAQHSARRSPWDGDRTLWAGYWIAAEAGTVFFAGDSGYGPHFRMIRARLGAPDLALLPIGAYEPRALMKRQHMNPAEAVAAHGELGARRSLGIHFATFRLTDEGHHRPAADLARARAAAGLAASAFVAPRFGETVEPDPRR